MHLRVRPEGKQMIDCDDDMMDACWYSCRGTTLETLRRALMARADFMNRLGGPYSVEVPGYKFDKFEVPGHGEIVDVTSLAEHVMEFIDAFPYRIGQPPNPVTAVERVHFANEAFTMFVANDPKHVGLRHLIDFRLHFGLKLPVVDWPADDEQRRLESRPNTRRETT